MAWEGIVDIMRAKTPEEIGFDEAQKIVEQAHKVLTPEIAQEFDNSYLGESCLCLLEKLQDYVRKEEHLQLIKKWETLHELHHENDAILDLETGKVIDGVLICQDQVHDDEQDERPRNPVMEARLLELWSSAKKTSASITELAHIFKFDRTTKKYSAAFKHFTPDKRGRQNQKLYNEKTIQNNIIPELARLYKL